MVYLTVALQLKDYLCNLSDFSCVLSSADVLSGMLSVSNSLDTDWADLDPNCLQRLPADDTSKQKVEHCTFTRIIT